jgi:hypothetical protein
MAITENDQLTPKEHLLLEAEKEEARLSREHAITIKQLDLALAKEKYQAQIELKKLEAKWGSWLRIPIIIIKLPISLVLAFGYIFAVLRKHEPSKSFWSLLS